MQVLKHVGKHNDKRIVLVYRQIPDEEHMCLVLYSDSLPQLLHDEVMQVLESAAGQSAEELADPLFRNVMKDGRNCLETLHREGQLKKISTNQVIITPNAKSNVRLDELNNILNQMAKGEEAIKKMADLDANSGMNTRRTPKDVGANPASRTTPVSPGNATVGDVLTDDQIAEQRRAQATQMKKEAQTLLAEAARLDDEAATFAKATQKNVTRKTRKAPAKKQEA